MNKFRVKQAESRQREEKRGERGRGGGAEENAVKMSLEERVMELLLR